MPTLDETISAGQTGHIADHQFLHERFNHSGLHVVDDYGAAGNSHHNTGGGTDDTTAIQDAYVAAQDDGGAVAFIGGRTYGITATIHTIPDPTRCGVATVGIGTRGLSGAVIKPNIVWNGSSGGVMFDAMTSGSNIPGVNFHNVRFAGRDLADTAIRYGPTSTNAAKLDSGAYLSEVDMAAFLGNALSIEGLGLTNFWIHGGRWDRIEGYGIYVKVSSQSIMSIRDVTWDGHSVADSCSGFAHFDGGANTPEGTNNTHYISCVMDTVHWESDNLAETIPGATENAGKRGIIRCTIEDAEIIVQHKLHFINCQNLGWSGSSASHCLIQMDGGSSNAERKAHLSVKPSDLFGFTGDGSAATGHVIPIGNCGLVPPLELASYPNEYLEFSHRFNGGSVINGNYPRVWNNTA